MKNHNRKECKDSNRADLFPEMESVPLEKMIEREINRFFSGHGRRPRVLISQFVQKKQVRQTNEVTSRQTATRFAQYGFDVDISPEHMTPDQLAKMAVDNDVHLICLLFNRDSAMEFRDPLSDALKNFSCDDVEVVFCHSNPPKPLNEAPSTGAADLTIINPGDAGDVLQLLKKLNREV